MMKKCPRRWDLYVGQNCPHLPALILLITLMNFRSPLMSSRVQSAQQTMAETLSVSGSPILSLPLTFDLQTVIGLVEQQKACAGKGI